MKEKTALIVPCYMEPNGTVGRFLKLAKAPETRREYAKLIKKLKTNPKEVGRKLREVTWEGKTADDIFEELVKG
jgi:effector-binding domain-containing protein